VSEIKRPAEQNNRDAKDDKRATAVPKVGIERDTEFKNAAGQKSEKIAQLQARTNCT
jgi:hypothetical protein